MNTLWVSSPILVHLIHINLRRSVCEVVSSAHWFVQAERSSESLSFEIGIHTSQLSVNGCLSSYAQSIESSLFGRRYRPGAGCLLLHLFA